MSKILGQDIIFVEFPGDVEKTDPQKIKEWFSHQFCQDNKVFAIKEEEQLLLKIFTHLREDANKELRKKGGKKSTFLGQEVHGDVLSACGKCGYYSTEGSNVRRHLKKAVCGKDRGYAKEQLEGLNKIERQKFIRRIASAKFRAKNRGKEVVKSFHSMKTSCPESTRVGSNNIPLDHQTINFDSQEKVKSLSKRLSLGPFVEEAAVERLSFDVFLLDQNTNQKIAWKPFSCHKASEERPNGCQIVFKGARMKRRCLNVPLPVILTYRKLDCKTHHCCFTLFHPHARNAFKADPQARSTVVVRNYGDTVMTQEFYYYFRSLMSIMKMKCSQTARHLTWTWETILAERLKAKTIPEDYKKIITLSKQTVKAMWKNIEAEIVKEGPRVKIQKKGRLSTLTEAAPSIEVSVQCPSFAATGDRYEETVASNQWTGQCPSTGTPLPNYPSSEDYYYLQGTFQAQYHSFLSQQDVANTSP